MAGKRSKKKQPSKTQQASVLHESSARSAQDLGFDKNMEKEEKALSNTRKHNGSDGADQERGSNH